MARTCVVVTDHDALSKFRRFAFGVCPWQLRCLRAGYTNTWFVVLFFGISPLTQKRRWRPHTYPKCPFYCYLYLAGFSPNR